MTAETDKTPHYQLTGGLKSLPDYNGLQKVVFPAYLSARSGSFCRVLQNKTAFSFRLPLKYQWLSPTLSLHYLSELLQLFKFQALLCFVYYFFYMHIIILFYFNVMTFFYIYSIFLYLFILTKIFYFL